MSQFDQKIKDAKKKQRYVLIGMSLLFIIGVLIVLTVMLVSRGTRIAVVPADAEETAELQLKSGIAVLTGDTLYSVSTTPVVSASAEGFYTKQQQLNKNDFGNVVEVELQPLPAKVFLDTGLNDGKSQWNIADQLNTIADKLETELAAGKYAISIDHPHYQEKTLAINLGRGETLEQTVQLVPINGELSINTIPSGAMIMIDEKPAHSSPLQHTVTGGYHQIVISMDNFETITEQVEITRLKPVLERNYRLERKKARASLQLAPAGGKLTVNGISVNETKQLKLDADVTHTLTYSKPGYFSQSKTLKLSATDNVNLTFELEKEFGKVNITSTPDADIEINGKAYGSTPQELSLLAVEQRVTFSRSGFRTVSKTVVPSSSKARQVSVSLVPEKLARLAEAPRQYKNKAGGSLLLFRPNETFSMGAPRSEPGQRVNEFVKQVSINKPFYAGLREVSYAEYQKFDPNKQGDANKPVTSVSWIDAAKYCNWLSQQEGREDVYRIVNNRLTGVNPQADGYRLLTEAEWEWLARKAVKPKQTRFVWGDETVIPKNAANIADESAKGTVKTYVSNYNDKHAAVADVGQFLKEPSGLFDQAGNVSEWVHDSYSIVPPAKGETFTQQLGSANGSLHVIKGANWRSGSLTELRPAFREGLSGGRDDVGFRIGRYVYGGQ